MDPPTSGPDQGPPPADAASRVIELRGRVLERDGAPLTTARLRELAAGARQIAADLDLVLEAIEVACAFVGAGAATAPAERPEAAWPRLTPRQRQIVDRLLAGARDRDIDRELGISVSTVKAHVSALLPALGVGSRRELHEVLWRFDPSLRRRREEER